MKRSSLFSATLALLAFVPGLAWAQGMSGAPSPAPYGGPVSGMPDYGGGLIPSTPGRIQGYGPPPGMGPPPPGLGGPQSMSALSSYAQPTGFGPPSGPPPGFGPPGGMGPPPGYGSPPPGYGGPPGYGAPPPGYGDPANYGPPQGYDVSQAAAQMQGAPPGYEQYQGGYDPGLSAEACDCQPCDGWLWGNMEGLVWWAKGSRLPPLVTTSTNPLEPRATAGVLDDPDTRVLFGASQNGDDAQGGARMTLGLWADPGHTIGIGNRFTILGGDTDNFSAASDGSTVLARPFFNSLTGQQDALQVALTDPVDGLLATGSVRSEFSNSFLSNEVYVRSMLENDGQKQVNFLVGYHFMRLDNFLSINSNSTFQDVFFNGTTLSVFDKFDTENEFHGGMVGFDGSYTNGRWSVDYLAKISYGRTRQTAEISGGTVLTFPMTPPSPVDGGLLAQGTNSGVFTRWTDTFIPEFNLGLRYQATRNISLGVGYNYLWISSVLLSGDQIDTNVNLSQQGGVLVGPARPRFVFNDTDYWLQGMNFSLKFNY